MAEIQQKGNLAYQQLDHEAKEKYETLAATANENMTSTTGSLTKEKIIRRIVNNIECNVSFTTTQVVQT